MGKRTCSLTFPDNNAGRLDGAVVFDKYLREDLKFDIAGVVMASNTALSGGAMVSTSKRPNIRDSRFEFNMAETDGGAIVLCGTSSSEWREMSNIFFGHNVAK